MIPFWLKKNSQPSVVSVVVLLFLASSVLRVGISAEVAIAEPINVASEPSKKTEDTSNITAKSAPDMQELLIAFGVREKRIQQQEIAFAKREKLIELSSQRLKDRLQALTIAEEELRSTIALANSAAEKDLARLTTVYENMKPKVAALMFQEMDPDFAAGFLGRMRPEIAADVLAGISPEIAYAISVILAGRNADIPKN